MNEKEIAELTKQAIDFCDHPAQLELGLYFSNLPFSNSNFKRAEKFLRLAAEKKYKNAIISLISLYKKYLIVLCNKEQFNNKTFDYYKELAIKWCNIAIKEKLSDCNYDDVKKDLIDLKPINIPSLTSNPTQPTISNNKTISRSNTNPKHHWGLMIWFFIISISFFFLVVIAIFILWIIGLISAHYLFLACCCWGVYGICFLSIILKPRLKNLHIKQMDNQKTTNLIDKPNKETKKDTTIHQEESIYRNMDLNAITSNQYMQKMLKYCNIMYDNTKRLDPLHLGKMGECYIYHLFNEDINIINSNFKNTILSNAKYQTTWINEEHETTDPYDFIITTNKNEKVFLDVKTSYINNAKFYMSKYQISFANKMKDKQIKYYVLYVSNFHFTNVKQFYDKKNRKPNINVIDIQDEQSFKKFDIIIKE